ncbi:uncharacterized protein B0H64DRAFT_435248 [Chaetomium fimeti]|uniref:F-box domain-containing protein n=1 Tax=Chaetomium fimeti TaxID=1854472 RepID=A0AAE0LPE7_9PEZI|nr:hypothetical protein B0H64DRAFT_435248 [Chaetomium fimeti]
MTSYATRMPGPFATPDRKCWLCGRESEILRYRHSRNYRSALFREITLPRDASERERTASISAILIAPPRSAGRRPKPPSSTEKTLHDSAYTKTTVRTWTFQVHADCWDLVACRVSDPTACATAFCKSLIANYRDHATPSRIPTPQTRPSSGPPRLTTPPGRNPRRANMHRLESFDGLAAELGLARLPSVHEPASLEQLHLFSYTTAPAAPLSADTTTNNKNNDPFTTLPPEILQLLASHTPTTDLLHLRLASRAVAHVSGLDGLPRSFWRSRFGPAFEMGFAQPARAGRDLDWRGMYFLVRRALRRYCGGGGGGVGLPRVESPLLARLAKRRIVTDEPVE